MNRPLSPLKHLQEGGKTAAIFIINNIQYNPNMEIYKNILYLNGHMKDFSAYV